MKKDMGDRKRLGILTSGGDCAGLNAVIRAAVYRGIHNYDFEVIGIKDGTLGLMNRPIQVRELDLEIFNSNMLHMGGTILGTINRGDPFAFPMPDGTIKDRSHDFISGYHLLGLHALIAIGGDGSLRILRQLAQAGGINMVGVPKTIDNDVAFTDYAVGFSTSVDVVVDALDRLQPTAASHHRVMVVEVMGRDAGHIALNAGIAGGADIILLPEIEYSLDGIVEKLAVVAKEGRSHAIVVVAEGVKDENGKKVTSSYGRYGGIGHYLCARIEELTKTETRVTVLGHTQRGGKPSMRDRVLASAFGVHAVDLVAQGKFDHMVAWHDRGVTEVPLEKIVGISRCVDPNDALVNAARGLGIYVGELTCFCKV